MLLDATGRPTPPAEIQARLKQVDPCLDLMWCDAGYGGGASYWGVVLRWTQNDPRRAMIQRGQMNPADDYDLLAMLPPDCSPYEAYGYVVNTFRRSGTDTTKQLLQRLHHYNKGVENDRWQPVMDKAMDEIETKSSKLFGEELQWTVKSLPTVKPKKRGKTAKEL